MRNPKRTEKGFSLIEMIVVLVIIGMAAAITAPFIFWTLERVEIRAAVKEIAASLRYGRSMAISQKEEIRFHMDLDEKIYWVSGAPRSKGSRGESGGQGPAQEENSGGGKNIAPPEKTQPIKKRSINPLANVYLFVRGEDEFDQGTVTISFSPFGTSTGGLIKLKTGDESSRPLFFTINVDPVTGRVKTKETEEES